MPEDLRAAFCALLARHSPTDPGPTAAALLEAWAQPHRRYHDLVHLREVLAHVETLAVHAADSDAVRLAAWYHDAVYAGRPDDEENSARRAVADLRALRVPAPLVDEVARLVRLTAAHSPAPGDANGETLCDADLAVLGADAPRYAAYAAAVREEYAAVPEADFRAGRTRILRALLDAPTLYRTPTARMAWEAAARANVRAELSRLEG